MTRNEMLDKLCDYCKSLDGCRGCLLEKECVNDGYTPFEICPDYELERMCNIIHDTTAEAVDHPDHYNRENSMEAIDEMILIFGKEAVANFCLCNVWKYRYRATDKHGKEDLAKSDWYMTKYKELKEELDKCRVKNVTVSNGWSSRITPL